MRFDKEIISLNDFITQPILIKRLKNYVKYCKHNNNFINMLIYGPKYSGKKKIAKCILSDIYNKSINNLEKIVYEQKTGNNSIEVCIYKSNYHYVIDPSKYMNYDKIVLIEFIKLFLSTKNISTNTFNICIIRARPVDARSISQY